MARFYRVFSSRTEASKGLLREVAQTEKPQSLYVVEETQPPMFIVGPPSLDVEASGATALFTAYPELGTEGDVRERMAELESTVSFLKDTNAELQRRVALAAKKVIEQARTIRGLEYHLNPPACPAGCEDVGSCCFCDGTESDVTVGGDHAP